MERLTKQGNAEEYWRSGGKLNRDSFEKARAVLLELANGEKLGVGDSSLARVEMMASFSRVRITWEQKYLYAVLREMTRKTEGRSDSSPETPGTMPPWFLSDQPLFAEVLLLTGDMVKRNSLINAYPSIFNK